MICKLCLCDKQLVNKSHIIPDFMYSDIFDENHSLIRFKSDDWDKERKLHTGEFEAGILCRDCEAKLSKFETYGRLILYGGKLPKGVNIRFENQKNQHGVEFTFATGIDYKKFKLFLLSILWRASISKRPFFGLVSLGKYEEVVRKMLVEEDPGPSDLFPCIINSYTKHASLPKELISEPKKIRMESGVIGYNFLISGMLYIFVISPLTSSMRPWVIEAAISESGELRVIHIPEEHGKRILSRYLQKEIP